VIVVPTNTSSTSGWPRERPKDAIFTAVDPDAPRDEFAATLLSEEEFVRSMPVGHELARSSPRAWGSR